PDRTGLAFHERRGWLDGLAQQSLAFTWRLAAQEMAFYGSAGPRALHDFYAELQRQAGGVWARQNATGTGGGGGGGGCLQIGWGTGGPAKTVGLALRAEPGSKTADDPRLRALVGRYRLDRGRGAPEFPKTRRLLEWNGVPDYPPGWVRFRLTPE